MITAVASFTPDDVEPTTATFVPTFTSEKLGDFTARSRKVVDLDTFTFTFDPLDVFTVKESPERFTDETVPNVAPAKPPKPPPPRAPLALVPMMIDDAWSTPEDVEPITATLVLTLTLEKFADFTALSRYIVDFETSTFSVLPLEVFSEKVSADRLTEETVPTVPPELVLAELTGAPAIAVTPPIAVVRTVTMAKARSRLPIRALPWRPGLAGKLPATRRHRPLMDGRPRALSLSVWVMPQIPSRRHDRRALERQ